jgi:hypothetical protein
LKRVKEMAGMAHVTIQRWVRWYVAGGLEEVARHQLGSGVRPYEHGHWPKSKGYGKRCRKDGFGR